jgi:hypothetical protein
MSRVFSAVYPSIPFNLSSTAYFSGKGSKQMGHLPSCSPIFLAFNILRCIGLPRSSYPSSFAIFLRYANSNWGSSLDSRRSSWRRLPSTSFAMTNSSRVRLRFGKDILRAGSKLTIRCDGTTMRIRKTDTPRVAERSARGLAASFARLIGEKNRGNGKSKD